MLPVCEWIKCTVMNCSSNYWKALKGKMFILPIPGFPVLPV